MLGIWGTVWLVVHWSRRHPYRVPPLLLAVAGVVLTLAAVGFLWWALTAGVSTAATPFAGGPGENCGSWIDASAGGPPGFGDDDYRSACSTASWWAGILRLSIGAGAVVAVAALLRPPRHRAR